jgi:hypothetical protein
MRAPGAGAPPRRALSAARTTGPAARPGWRGALVQALGAVLLICASPGGSAAAPPERDVAPVTTTGMGAASGSASGSGTGLGSASGSGSGSGSGSVSGTGSESETGSESASGSGSASASGTGSASGTATQAASAEAAEGSGADQPGAGSPSAPSLADLLERLSGAPDEGVSAIVAAIEAISARSASAPVGDAVSPGELAMLPDALFAAARACEERLRDPARALPLYARILDHFPDARVAIAAGRRARHLREQLGAHGGSSEEARAFSQLVADGERLPLPELLGRADALAARAWPGAAEVLLWSAELVRRRGDLAEAARRYRAVIDRFSAQRPAASASVTLAIRGLAGAALERGDWALAEKMALALPATTPADAITRDELLDKARAGRRHSGLAWLARAALLLSALGLLFSLHQVHRGAPRAALRALLRPPVEVAYMAPVAALLVAASFTGNHSITPAVVLICLGGLAISWLSGATLASARRAARDSPRRTLLHLLGCFAAVLSLAYLAIVGTGLLDLLISTIQLGPER